MNASMIILVVLSLLALGLGGMLFFADRKNEVNQLLCLWMISLAIWSLTFAGFFAASAAVSALYWARAGFAAAAVSAVAFWFFSMLVSREQKTHAVYSPMFLVSLVLMCGATIFSPLVVGVVHGRVGAFTVEVSAVGWWFFIGYLSYFFFSAHSALLARRSTQNPADIARPFWNLLVAGQVAGICAVLVLTFPAINEWRYAWLAPVATTVALIPFVVYERGRGHVRSAGGVLSELLVGTTAIFSMVDMLYVHNAKEFAFRFCIALGLVLSGVILIRRMNADERKTREIRALAAQLTSMNKHLEAADVMKSEFISIASHQLRTPVSVLKGYLSLIMEGAYGNTPPAVGEKLQEMFVMNERLVHLINNILNMSRIEKNTLEYAFARVDVGVLAGVLAKEFEGKAREKHVQIKLDVPSKPLMAYSDASKLQEIIANLLDNAIKYSDHGVIEMVVKPVKEDGGDYVLLTIKDEGVGMDDSEKNRVFEKFYRVSMPSELYQSGSGLGLYICRKFMQGLGGRVWIERTELGKGTTVAVVIPTLEAQIPAKTQIASAQHGVLTSRGPMV